MVKYPLRQYIRWCKSCNNYFKADGKFCSVCQKCIKKNKKKLIESRDINNYKKKIDKLIKLFTPSDLDNLSKL